MLSIGQTVTLECYKNDTLQKRDCEICTKPEDNQLFTGVIVQTIDGSDTTRDKIYFPYSAKIRPTDVLLYDSKSNRSFFDMNDIPFTYTQTIDWFKRCHYSAVIEDYYISNDSIFIKLIGDTTHFIKLPSGFTDTDDQIITDFYIDGMDSLVIKLENDSIYHKVYLGDLIASGGMDKQRFDRNEIINDTIWQSLQRDSVADIALDLKPYLDNTDSQKLYINQFGDSLIIGGGNRVPFPVDKYSTNMLFNNSSRILVINRNNGLPDLSDTIPDSDNQDLYRTGNLLRITNSSSSVDISDLAVDNYLLSGTFVNNTRTLTLTRNNSLPAINIIIPDRDSQYVVHGGTSQYIFTLTGQSGNTGQFILNSSNGITITHNGTGISTFDGSKLQWIAKGDMGTNFLIGDHSSSETVYFKGLGIVQTKTMPGTAVDTICIIAYEVDSSITNEAQSLTNIGTNTVTTTLNSINSIGGGFITHQTTNGINLSHSSNVVTWSVNDKDSTNEIQVLSTILQSTNLSKTSLSRNGNHFLVRGLTGITITTSGDTINVTSNGAMFDTDDQFVDSFLIVGNKLRISLKDDNVTYSEVDLSPYVNVGTNLSWTIGTNTVNSSTGTGTAIPSFGANINILSTLGDKDSQAGTNGQLLMSTGTGIDWQSLIAGNGISISGLTISNNVLNGIGSGGASSSTFITSHPSQNAITINVAGGLTISETTSSNGGSITITNTVVDTDTDNYVDSFTFSYPNRTLTIGRNILSNLSVVVPDRDSQIFVSSGLVLGLQNTTSNATFIQSGILTITAGGTSANPTFTFNVPAYTDNDNYVTGATFNDSQDSLLITRNLLSTIRLKIPDTDSQTLYKVNPYSIGITRGNVIDLSNYIDHDWYNFRTKQPPTSITDTIFTKNFVGINDTTPDNDLDVEGVFSLRNRQGVGETRFDMNWNTTTGNSSDYVYHIDFNRDNTDVKDGTYQGYIDYHLHDAYPTMTTASYGRMVFGVNNGGNAVTNSLILHKDTAIMHNARIEFKLKDKDYSSGNQGNLLTSFNGTNIKWDSLKASSGMIINNQTLTLSTKDTSETNEIQNILPYIVSGDTIGFLLSKIPGIFDTVIIAGDTSGMSEIIGGGGGGGSFSITPFIHTIGSNFLLSTLDTLGSIRIASGTQIEVVPSGSGKNGIATIKTNFNGCPTCVPFFGSSVGFTNDSLITDVLFKYYLDEGIPTLEVPTLNLTQTNQYSNPVALYIAANNDERVFTSSVDVSGFNSNNFYHKVNSAGITISLPSGHTGASTHYIINDQSFNFTLARTGVETIDGTTSVAFTTNDKLVTVVNDGSGKWVTSKTVSASSSNISYPIGPASPPQSIGTTTMSDIQNSTSPSIPAGRYIVRVNVKAQSWGIGEGYAMQLAAVSGSVTLNIGKWQVYDCTGTTITLNQFGITLPTANSGISCNSNSIIYGECDITVNSAATIKIQLGVETSGRAANIWSGTVELFKIG